LKQLIREKYTEISNQSVDLNKKTCCGIGGSCNPLAQIVDSSIFA